MILTLCEAVPEIEKERERERVHLISAANYAKVVPALGVLLTKARSPSRQWPFVPTYGGE